MTPEQERALAIARARKRKAEATGTTPQAILGTKATSVLQGAFGGSPAAPEPVRPVSRLESFDRGAQKGGAFGGSDEAAGIRALTNAAPMAGPLGAIQNLGFGVAGLALEALPGKAPAAYTQGRDIQRSLEGDAQRANPVTSMVGEIAGSIAVPVGGTARAATKGGQIAKGVAVGAGTGGAYSFAAEDGSLEDRAKAGAVGAGLGGAFGGALSAVIPRDIPLGDVLNAEIFGTKVERPVIKTIERLLVEAGVSPNDVTSGMVQLRNRLNSSQSSAGLPTRFKDELINQFGDKARGVRDAIENQIRGGAVRSGSASDTAVRAAVSEDNAAARELFGRSVDQLAGSTNRPELRGQALDQLQEIVESRYKPILSQPIADPAKQQRLMSVLQTPRMQSLATELAEDAEREGIDLAALMARNPAEAAHWMQSKARQLADDRGTVTITGAVKPDRTMSNRRADILAALEDAVPGYRETRMEYGDKFGVLEAVNFAKGFMNRAKDDVSVADMAEEFANMSAAQKQMALASVRSALQGSASNTRYMDPELGTAALRTAEIGKEPVLKALSEVFGEQGTKVADDIKAIITRTDANRRINPQATGSDTMPKAEAAKFAIRNTRGPVQRFVGDMFGGLPIDLTASAFTGGPTPVAAARAGVQGAGKMADNRALSTVDKVTGLLLSKPQNALASRALPPPGAPPSGGAAIIDELSAQPAPSATNAFAPNSPIRAGGLPTVKGVAKSLLFDAGGGAAGYAASKDLDLNGDGVSNWEDRLWGAGMGVVGRRVAAPFVRNAAEFMNPSMSPGPRRIRPETAPPPPQGPWSPMGPEQVDIEWQRAVETAKRDLDAAEGAGTYSPENLQYEAEQYFMSQFGGRNLPEDTASLPAQVMQGGGVKPSGFAPSVRGDLGNALIGAGFGGITPADSPEERARNMAIGAGVGLAPGAINRVRGASRTARGVDDVASAGPKTAAQATRFETPGSAEYEAALAKGLRMDQTSRKARAAEQGYDTGKVWYHGTRRNFDAFDPERSRDGLGIHLGTVDQADTIIEEGRSLANKNPEPYQKNAQILPLYVRATKPLRLPDLGEWEPNQVAAALGKRGIEVRGSGQVLPNGKRAVEPGDIVDAIERSGYDSIVYKNTFEGMDAVTGKGADSLIVFDPSNIRSVNAAFDPDKAASPILTAGAPGGPRKPRAPKPKADSPEAIKAAVKGIATAKPKEPTRLERMVEEGKDAAVPPINPMPSEAGAAGDKALRMLERGKTPLDIYDETSVVMLPYNGANIPIVSPKMGPEELTRVFYTWLAEPPAKRPAWVKQIIADAPKKKGMMLTQKVDKPAQPANALAQGPAPKAGPSAASIALGTGAGLVTGVPAGVMAGTLIAREQDKRRNALAN